MRRWFQYAAHGYTRRLMPRFVIRRSQLYSGVGVGFRSGVLERLEYLWSSRMRAAGVKADARLERAFRRSGLPLWTIAAISLYPTCSIDVIDQESHFPRSHTKIPLGYWRL
jgi:hypothetical protein